MLHVRRATDSDSEDLWEWRNDAASRSASLSSDPVSWDDHSRWFGRAVLDPQRAIYIGEVPTELDSSVGMCRFDISPDRTSAEVSINLNPDHRGKRLSTGLLLESIKQFRVDFGSVTELTALIKESNIPSKKLFIAAGFAPVSQTDGVGSYELSLAE